MSRLSYLSRNGCIFAAVALLAATTITPAFAQQNQTYRGSVITDWTTRHVLFSDAGTLVDAMMNGKRAQWQRVVNDPRYQMQLVRRQGNHGGPPSSPASKKTGKTVLHRDWSVQIAPAGSGVAAWAYPAKYSFNPAAAANCTSDYVVFPVYANGSSTQANIVGVNNLYNGSCTTGTVPSVLFAYEVGTGQVYNSPTLSLDGTKIAFVESITGGSKFHVLTIDQSGNSGCATNASPCNGASYSTPAVPGVNNAAVDTAIVMSGGVSDTFSSPFVDYTHDVAYVGDDAGNLHKFTGVFLGTPTEVVGDGWPYDVATGSALTSPTYDSVSQDVFIATQYGGSVNTTGVLYCVNAAAATASGCSAFSTLVGTNIFDGPVVDSTWEQVFVTADNATTTGMILFQTPVNFSSSVTVSYGAAGTYHYTGAFDNAYYTSVSTGHIYACGNLSTAATPVLFRVGFNSSGVMSSTADSSGSFQLVTGYSGLGASCTPLTEFYNLNQATDYLFLGVGYGGVDDAGNNCGGVACVTNFSLPTSSPFTFPAGFFAAPVTENFFNAFSAIIVDNYSTAAGASQIYFGDQGTGYGIQVSQETLD